MILGRRTTSFDEHQRTSRRGADLSLNYNTIVFFFATEHDLRQGRFAIHRAIMREGVAA